MVKPTISNVIAYVIHYFLLFLFYVFIIFSVLYVLMLLHGFNDGVSVKSVFDVGFFSAR